MKSALPCRNTSSPKTKLREYVQLGTNCPPEVEEGNVEYKLKLFPPNNDRFQHLVSQLKWRLSEYGQCFYEIGIDDDGTIVGIEKADLDQSIITLVQMCRSIDAKIMTQERIRLESGRYVAEVSIRPACYLSKLQPTNSSANTASNSFLQTEATQPKNEPSIEKSKNFRIALLGETNSGKSTLLGVLSYGHLDNGKGNVRMNLLRHRHEVLSGQTSSIAIEYLPFKYEDSTKTYCPIRVDYGETLLSEQKMLLTADKVIQFFDMAGHPRYQRSTFTALSSCGGPNLIFIVVSATSFIDSITGFLNTKSLVNSLEENRRIANLLRIPYCIAVTKVDNMANLDPVTCIDDIRREVGYPALPIFLASSVTGQGIAEIEKFLSNLDRPINQSTANISLPIEMHCPNGLFLVENVQHIPDVGFVLNGIVVTGSVSVGKEYIVGPDNQGTCFVTKVVSIHRLRQPVSIAYQEQAATLAVENSNLDREDCWPFMRGMLLFNGNFGNCGKAKAQLDLMLSNLIPLCSSLEAILEPIQLPAPIVTNLQGTVFINGSRSVARLNQLEGSRFTILISQGVRFVQAGFKVLFLGDNGLKLAGYVVDSSG